jgi:hypothetical protein
MNIDVQAIIGFLSGSLAAIIIRFVLDQITSRQSFNRELKKLTFTRKLEKAENAIALYRTYTIKIIELQKSFELTISVMNNIEETEKDLSGVLELISKNQLFLNELSTEKYSHINSMHLYFDLDGSEQRNEENLEKMLDILADISGLNNTLKFWGDLDNKANADGNDELAEYYWNKIKACIPSYVSSIERFIEVIKVSRQESETVITKIKQQVKIR